MAFSNKLKNKDMSKKHLEEFNIKALEEAKFLAEFPDEWCVRGGKELKDLLKEEANVYGSKDDFYYRCSDIKNILSSKNWDCSSSPDNLISIETFKKYLQIIGELPKQEEIMKTTDKRFPFKLSEENVIKIIKIACTNWKSDLTKLWLPEAFTDGYVLISEPYYKEMRKACTVEQNKLFDEIFGKDIEEKPFPKFMRSGSLVILFTSLKTGIVVVGDNNYDAGHSNSYWAMDTFKDCELEIKIK